MRLPRRLARRLRGAALAGALGALVLPTAALAALPVDHVAVEATDVDRDGIIAPGDTITFDEVIRNTSSTADLGGLAATLTALTPKVVVQQGQSGYPLLGPLATGANLTPFQATLPSTIECGQNVGFSMALRSSSDSSNVVFDVGTGTAGPREAHESTDVPLPIPNGDRVVSTLGVPPGAIVKDVRVRIGHIRHDFVDDLSLALIGPDGTRVPLVSNAGGSGDDYVDTVFARNGATIATAAAPFTGTYRAERLAEFAGKPAGGTWKLELRDSNAADAGTLLDWGLDISAATCAAQPVAHATATPNPALPGEPVVFDGSDSVDPRAPILRYEWDLDGDGTFETDTGLVPLAMRSYPVKGAHTAALRITDANGDTDTEEVPFAVTQRPVAGLAVSDATPLSGEEVTFDAGGSRDPDGALVRYEWDVNGDGTFERDTGGGARLATSFATPGPRSVRVRVTDDLGATAVTQLGVVVRNRAPTARLTGPAPAVAGATATLDARGSTDPDGRVERYQWDLDGDGVFETDGAATLDHVFTASGPRSVGVRVTDDSGATADGTLDVTVTERPTARIEATPNPARPSDVVTLDAAGSTDPEGPVARYEWDLDGDGSFETDTAGAATTARRFDAGDREVAVRVTDGDGAREVASITLQVVNRAPVAAFTTGPGPAVAGRPVTFDASASHDDDGTVVRYEWDLDGDGIFETDGGASPTAALTYANAGRFDVSLRVTDSDRTSTVRAETLTVEPAPAPAAVGDGWAGSGAGPGSAAGAGDAAPATGSGGPGPGGGSGGTSAGGGAGGGGSVARGFRPSLAGAAIQRLRTVLARGVRLTCRADRAARCTVALTLQLRDARRLGLAGKRAKRPVTVGRATAQASATADGRVVLRLSRKVQRRLRRARSVVLLVTGRAVAADGRRATLRRAVLVRR